MANESRDQSLSWDRKIKEVWDNLTHNPPDTPYYQKLALLAQLKAAQAGNDAAGVVAGYTKWLMFLTGVIVLCTIVQTVFGILTYLHRSPQ